MPRTRTMAVCDHQAWLTLGEQQCDRLGVSCVSAEHTVRTQQPKVTRAGYRRLGLAERVKERDRDREPGAASRRPDLYCCPMRFSTRCAPPLGRSSARLF